MSGSRAINPGGTFRPKKSGPDQRAPVISAIAEKAATLSDEAKLSLNSR